MSKHEALEIFFHGGSISFRGVPTKGAQMLYQLLFATFCLIIIGALPATWWSRQSLNKTWEVELSSMI